MLVPNYKKKKNVNLMSSLSQAFKHKSAYPVLKSLMPKELKESKNVVLFVIDGFGYDFIKKHVPGGFFQENLHDVITTVFPSTTAAAITTFKTGVPPQQHGLTSWIMHFKELGTLGLPLPYVCRQGGRLRVPPQYFLPENLFDKLKTKTLIITKKDFKDKPYNKATTGKSTELYYESFEGMFLQLRKAINWSNRRKFIYCYWPLLDTFSHHFGKDSVEVKIHVRSLQKRIKSFMEKTENTVMIITADHGHMDTTPKNTIILNEHPKLMECLTLPACGEPRALFCYVRPSKDKQFRDYVKKKFSNYCTLVKGEDLIKKKYFGLGKPHPRLTDRVGDYVLLAKKNYTFRDLLVNEEFRPMIGNHGGLSKEEMEVPLIVVKS